MFRIGRVLVLAFGMTGQAFALSSYSYSGQNFISVADTPSPPGITFATSDSVRVVIEFGAILAGGLAGVDLSSSVATYSATAGAVTLTDQNSFVTAMTLSTDLRGQISAWDVRFTQLGFPTNPGSLGTIATASAGVPPTQIGFDFAELFCVDMVRCGDLGTDDEAFVENSPGSWSLVPEPYAALLLVVALTGLSVSRDALP